MGTVNIQSMYAQKFHFHDQFIKITKALMKTLTEFFPHSLSVLISPVIHSQLKYMALTFGV